MAERYTRNLADYLTPIGSGLTPAPPTTLDRHRRTALETRLRALADARHRAFNELRCAP